MSTAKKIKDRISLKKWVDEQRANGEQVVFTNGCFDILHLGHIDYLEKARALGDHLVVGLNSDASVCRLKGPDRPINKEYARGRMLAALAFVDAVCVFEEDTPKELIETINPHVLVKGGDYSIETIVGAEFVMKHGGVVKTIDLVDGFSTTSMIEKIKK
jgi:rfaE bifunctional protein nucleotidyltransferase chain/domain